MGFSVLTAALNTLGILAADISLSVVREAIRVLLHVRPPKRTLVLLVGYPTALLVSAGCAVGVYLFYAVCKVHCATNCLK